MIKRTNKGSGIGMITATLLYYFLVPTVTTQGSALHPYAACAQDFVGLGPCRHRAGC